MEGRSEPQSLTPDPVDPLDPVVNSEWRVLGMKNNDNETCRSRICNTPSVFATFVFQMSTLQRFYCFLQKQSQNTRYCHQKIMFLAATDLKMIRKHYDFIVCLRQSSKFVGVVTFGKQK